MVPDKDRTAIERKVYPAEVSYTLLIPFSIRSLITCRPVKG